MSIGFDLYEILGVDKDATLADIKAAHRKRIKEVHPDTNKDLQSDNEEVHKVNLAYSTLSRAKARAEYDDTGDVLEKDDSQEELRAKAKRQVLDLFLTLIVNGQIKTHNLSAAKNALISSTLQRKLQANSDTNKAIKSLKNTLETLVYATTGKNETGVPFYVVDALKDKIEEIKDQIKGLRAAYNFYDYCIEYIQDLSFYDKPVLETNLLGGPAKVEKSDYYRSATTQGFTISSTDIKFR